MRTAAIKVEGGKTMKSKYYTSWEEYRETHPELEGKPVEVIAPKIQKYEDIMFNFIMSLLL